MCVLVWPPQLQLPQRLARADKMPASLGIQAACCRGLLATLCLQCWWMLEPCLHDAAHAATTDGVKLG